MRILDYQKSEYGLALKCELAKKMESLRLSFPSSRILRLRVGEPENTKDEIHSKVKVRENERGFFLETDHLKVWIDKKKATISNYAKKEEIIFSDGMLGRVDGRLCFSASTEGKYFFGLGEKFDSFNQNSKRVEIWAYNPRGDLGKTITYLPVPFFIDSKGYGLFLKSTYRSIFYINSSERGKWFIETEDPRLDLYFIYGPEFSQVLTGYAALTGLPILPPRWSLEPWHSKDTYRSRDEVEAICTKIRELDIPCGVIVIDWLGWQEGHCNLKFTRDFPEPHKMIKKIHELGMKVILWEAPFQFDGYIAPGEDRTLRFSISPIYQDLVNKGYLVKTTKGGIAKSTLGAYVDFTNPQAARFWKERHKELMRMGVDGFKVDMGEGIPEDALFYNGKTGKEMHNLYPNLHKKNVYEAMQEEKIDGVSWARSGTFGIQKYSVIWAGDQKTEFEHLKLTIIAGLSAAMSGISMWGHDIGGYFGDHQKALFLRWAQFGTFSPFMQIHGSGKNVEPWSFDEEALDIYRFYARLRYNLIPYLFSYVKRSRDTGLPILQPLVLRYQNDPEVYRIDTQYLLGEELMVAPIYEETDMRSIYLPKGLWIDFWNTREYSGPVTLNYRAPLDKIPVFIRKGAIIPMELNEKYEIGGAMGKTRRLTFNIYPFGHSRFQLFLGDKVIPLECQGSQNQISIKAERMIERFVLRIKCTIPDLILSSGTKIRRSRSLEEFNQKQEGWLFDVQTGFLLVAISGKDRLDLVIKNTSF